MRSDWSDAARSAWGKTSSYDAEAWMPLVQHLEDSADVAGLVWPWLPQRVQQTIEDDLPGGEGCGRMLLRWLAGVHDVGKCSPPFATKVPVLADRMRDQGLTPPRDRTDFSKAPHGLVGHAILARWLRSRYGATSRAARTYSIIVGGHHGVPPTSSKLQYLAVRGHLIGDGPWQEAQDEILDGMAAYTGVTELLPEWASHRLPPTAQAVLTGAVIVSDWLASNTELFPFDSVEGEERARLAWDALGLPAPWRPSVTPCDTAEHLNRRFPGVGTTPRSIQTLTVAAASQTTSSPLFIVESTMGSGKTEAALMAAEILARRFGCGGVFVGLPTMATSDGMFSRVLDWIDNLEDGGRMSAYLAHGKAGLNDDYRGLATRPRLAHVNDEREPTGRTEAQVEAWLTGRKKGVLASMVVGTVDQLLFVALQSKHAALRHLAFAGKVIVVDEVHAADDFMRMFLCRALEWLAAYGVPVVLLSATLPSSQRQELADAYRAGLGQVAEQLPSTRGYPLVTTVTAAGVRIAADDTPAESVGVLLRTVTDDLDSLTELLDEWLAEGGCVGVVRNTVGRAQDTAAHLSERFGEAVVLHHSRFIATHRAQRESHLRDELGRDSSHRPRYRIVVGTQVLEQSLDVDFDALVTDLAPVDLMLQRIGRLHRHHRKRPARLKRPEVVVTGIEEWGAGGPTPDPGSRRVYGLSRLLRAAGALGLDGTSSFELSLPSEIRRLVEAAYGDEPPVPPAWRSAAEEADQTYAASIAEAKARADHFRMRSIPDLEGSLLNWLEDSSSEAEESQGSARVRDSDDGIEVIVTQSIDGEVRYIDDGSHHAGRLIPTEAGAVPDSELARALAATTVRLPLTMIRSGADFERTLTALEANCYEGWQQSHWLKGQLVLHLDADWRASLAGFDLTYDLDQGLTVTREEQAT